MGRRQDDQTHPGPGGTTSADPASADPVTAAQLRSGTAPDDVAVQGLTPGTMGEGIGVHDGTAEAGEAGYATSQGAGATVGEDVSEGRPSTDADRAAHGKGLRQG
jgi:hypothetical protein